MIQGVDGAKIAHIGKLLAEKSKETLHEFDVDNLRDVILIMNDLKFRIVEHSYKYGENVCDSDLEALKKAIELDTDFNRHGWSMLGKGLLKK